MSAYSDLISGTSGLLGYWRLGDSSGTAAVDALGVVNGVYSPNSAGAWTGGTLGSASLLPGDSANSAATISRALVSGAGGIRIDDTSGRWNTTTITLECWVRITGTYGVNGYIIDRDETPSSTKRFFQWRITSGVIEWILFFTNGNIVTFSGGSLSAATTYHLVATYDGVTVKLYVNGVAVLSTAETRTLNNTGVCDLYIGRHGFSGSADTTDGTFDEPAFYSRALSGAEVLSHYTAGIQTFQPAFAANATGMAA